MSNQDLRDSMVMNIPHLLIGPPGIGKTARIIQTANEVGFDEVLISRTSTAERTDYAGCMIPNSDKGVTEMLPLDMLHKLRTSKKRIYLFLDDMGQAPFDVQAAIMSFWDNDNLPKNILIGGATNRVQDRAGVKGMLEPLRSRFRAKFAIPTPDSKEDTNGPVYLGTWQDEVSGWIDWAFDYGAPAEVIAWIRAAGDRSNKTADGKDSVTKNPLYAWRPSAESDISFPDYRGWQEVINLWNANVRRFSMIASVIGKPAAQEFLTFARLADQLPSPDEVFANPHNALVPHEAQAQFLIMSMLAGAAKIGDVPAVLTYIDRLPRPMQAYLAKDLQKKFGNQIPGTAWNTWFLKNRELFQIG